MSQGNFGAQPPQSGGGSKTLITVLVVLGVFGLICVGICGVGYYLVMEGGKRVLGEIIATGTMEMIRQDLQVTGELGDTLSHENARFVMQGESGIVEFDVKGTKANAKARVEFSGAEPKPGEPPPKPGKITVTLPSGKAVDVAIEPQQPGGEPFTLPEMPDGSGDINGIDSNNPIETSDM